MERHWVRIILLCTLILVLPKMLVVWLINVGNLLVVWAKHVHSPYHWAQLLYFGGMKNMSSALCEKILQTFLLTAFPPCSQLSSALATFNAACNAPLARPPQLAAVASIPQFPNNCGWQSFPNVSFKCKPQVEALVWRKRFFFICLVNIGGGGSSGKSNGGDEVADGDVLVEGDETRGDGGTGTCLCVVMWQ